MRAVRGDNMRYITVVASDIGRGADISRHRRNISRIGMRGLEKRDCLRAPVYRDRRTRCSRIFVISRRIFGDRRTDGRIHNRVSSVRVYLRLYNRPYRKRKESCRVSRRHDRGHGDTLCRGHGVVYVHNEKSAHPLACRMRSSLPSGRCREDRRRIASRIRTEKKGHLRAAVRRARANQHENHGDLPAICGADEKSRGKLQKVAKNFILGG